MTETMRKRLRKEVITVQLNTLFLVGTGLWVLASNMTMGLILLTVNLLIIVLMVNACTKLISNLTRIEAFTFVQYISEGWDAMRVEIAKLDELAEQEKTSYKRYMSEKYANFIRGIVTDMHDEYGTITEALFNEGARNERPTN